MIASILFFEISQYFFSQKVGIVFFNIINLFLAKTICYSATKILLCYRRSPHFVIFGTEWLSWNAGTVFSIKHQNGSKEFQKSPFWASFCKILVKLEALKKVKFDCKNLTLHDLIINHCALINYENVNLCNLCGPKLIHFNLPH